MGGSGISLSCEMDVFFVVVVVGIGYSYCSDLQLRHHCFYNATRLVRIHIQSKLARKASSLKFHPANGVFTRSLSPAGVP